MLPSAPYTSQLSAWPPTGRHIMASFDADSVVGLAGSPA